MYTCMYNRVTLLYSRKLAEHCKPAIMEKIKIITKEKKEYFSFSILRLSEKRNTQLNELLMVEFQITVEEMLNLCKVVHF